MRANDAGTVVALDLSLDVSVPFVGRALEDKALGYVEAVVADERRRAEAVSRNRPLILSSRSAGTIFSAGTGRHTACT